MSQSQSQKSKTKVITGIVRLSYAHIWEPTAGMEPGSGLKYSCALLIPKTDKETVNALKEAEEAAFAEGIADKWGGKKPSEAVSILKDGDLKENEEYKGHWYINANSKDKPGIVDRFAKPIMDRDEVYSGCYARVSVNVFPYSVMNDKKQVIKRGVGVGLNNIMKVKDGEAFAGKASAESDFKDFVGVEEEASILD